ncbi:MAG: PfkB family carbohydrate kinase [Thermoprotei archaeon]
MKIACIGAVTLDEIMKAGHTYIRAGGTSFFSALALLALGDKVTVFSSYGSDWNAPETALNSLGINTMRLGDTTTKFAITYNGERRRLYLREPSRRLYIDESSIKGYDGALIGPVAQEIDPHLLQRIKGLNIPIAVGIQGFIRAFAKNGLVKNRKADLSFLNGTFLISGSRREFSVALGGLNQIDAIQAKYKIVSRGKNGASLYYGSNRFFAKAEGISVDPTGAGDILLASAFHYLMKNKSPDETLSLSTALATASTRQSGFQKLEEMKRALASLSVSQRRRGPSGRKTYQLFRLGS